MNTNSIRLDVQALIPLILDKSKSKDNVRLQSCHRLATLLQSNCDMSNVTDSWENLVSELNRVLSTKSGNLELKRAVGDCISEIFGFIPDCLDWMVEWMKKSYELFYKKEENAIYVSILHNALVIASKRFIEFGVIVRETRAVPDILTFLLGQLESANSPVVLPALLNFSAFLADKFIDDFHPFLKPFAEMVIGWMVSENSESVQLKCRKLLRILGPRLRNEDDYGRTMMLDFLLDVDRCVEEITPDNRRRLIVLKKCCSILRVLNAFVDICLGTKESYDKTIILEVFDEALAYGNKHFQSLQQHSCSNVTLFFVEYVHLFGQIPPRDNGKMTPTFLKGEKFVLRLCEHFHRCSAIEMACIDFYTKLFAEKALTVPHSITTIHNLLGERGCFINFNPVNRPAASKTFTTMVSSLLVPSSLDSLLTAYDVIRKRIRGDLSVISEDGSNQSTTCIIRVAEARICCYLSAFRKIVTVKNSFLVMGLNPSIMHFLCVELTICTERFLLDFPSLVLLILRLIVSHSASHEYFVATSEWLVDTGRNGMVSESATGKHAYVQLATISKLLQLNISWNSIRSLIGDWTCGFLEKFSLDTLERLADRNEWMLFYKSLLQHQLSADCDDRLRSLAKTISCFQHIKENSASFVTKAIADKLGCMKLTKRCSLWRSQNMVSYVKCAVNLDSWDAWEMTQSRVPSATSFGANEFIILSDFLLKRIVPSFKKTPKTDLEWMFDTIQQLFTNSQNMDTRSDGKTSLQLSIIEKWRWCLAQMANYCIENRMKTPIGKPMETFNAFGAEVQKLAKEALGMAAPSRAAPKNVTNEARDLLRELKSPDQPRKTRKERQEEEDDAEYGAPGVLTSAEEWWRVRCLLEFVDVLEKLIHNSCSGSFFHITSVSQLARQFFVTNIANCLEWLNRTYSPALVVAYYNGYYAQVIRFGTSALVDLEKKALRSVADAAKKIDGGTDSQRTNTVVQPPPLTYVVLGWMARAMAELGAEQSIRGLRMWAKKVYHFDMDWLEGAAEFAAARYESSLVLIRKSLENSQLLDSAKTILRYMCLDALLRLRNPILVNPAICPPHLCIWSEAERMDGALPSGFDTDAFLRVQQLCSFQKTEFPKEPNVKWDLTAHSHHVELQMMQTLRRVDVQVVRDDVASLGSMLLMADSGQRLHARIAILDMITNGVLSRMNSKTSMPAVLSPELVVNGSAQPDMAEKLQLSRRLQIWSHRLTGDPAHREIARLARKTGNTHLATDSFEKLRSNNLSDPSNLFVITQEMKMVWHMSDVEKRSLDITNLFMLVAHHFDLDVQRKGMIAMFAESNVSGPLPPLPPDSSEQLSRTTLRMADWLRETPQAISLIQANCRNTNLWHALEGISRDMNCDLVGSLLASAAQACPQLAKTHLKLADWSFNAATGSEGDRTAFNSNYQLLLGSDVAPSVLDSLWKLLGVSRNVQELENGVKSLLKQDTSSINLLLNSSSHFMNLWSHMRQRQATFFTVALNGYFAFLNQHFNTNGISSSSVGTVSATLRILDLLVQHGTLLKPTILAGLQKTNENMWKDIVPQLFSRLSHPSSEVREVIVDLLSRICRSSPHSLVYQIVSGASNSMLVESNDDVIDETDKDVDYKADEDRNLMIESCRQLESYIQKLYPKLVEDVREFVSELQKINLLFEERWLFVLSNLDHEMSKRFEQIQHEYEKSMKATHLDEKTRLGLIAEKTQLITDSVYSLLNDLYERTCIQEPGTVNEKTFIDMFSEQLKNAFTTSTANKKSPEKAWAPFKQILALLIQRNARRGSQNLLVSNISNYLSKLNGSSVPLPGQEDKEFCDLITLSSVEPNALILPTKTRPKKLSFVGSDGKSQAFLFKGQEDLHLDERVMQLLHICNLLLSGASRRNWPSHTARHYAVTPLGTRSGLIQWVGGATSMFQIYRKWQIRQAQIKQAMEKEGSTANVEIQRPTDMYQKALRAAFASHNVDSTVIADRSKWPAPVLKEVLHTLMKDTPKDLLNRELWMRSGNGDTWWRVVSRFARSSAVMSMIGAVLGLGDRHLDNLLINLDKGDIIHIDYNICFDKGRQLRVPETVPFRLTQNFVNALGPTQIEGVFRESCSNVLSTLRNNREILLTVLDAFVYDPLVDWAATDHLNATAGVAVTFAVYGADRRAAASKPLARSMFSVRIKELKTPWMQNCSELTEALNNVKTVLEKQLLMSLGGGNNVWSTTESLNQEKVESGRRLKAAISSHHNMMKDFKPLLRALATCDERFVTFATIYRERFREPLIRGHQFVEGETTDIPSCVKLFNIVINNARGVYELLIHLDTKETLPAQFLIGPALTPSSVMPPPPGLEETHNQQQEQNMQAKNVVRRVRARLEGRDLSDTKKAMMSPNEQADTWIRQATSSTLLSMMYEGWTAWV